nr:NAD(+)/NADH kinase [Anaerolineaceae bacterium]
MLMPNVAVPRANLLAERIRAFLRGSGSEVNIFNYNFEEPGASPDLTGIDLLIVLGGDGSLLRAGHFCAPLGIPLLGIQTGRLGFLVEVKEIDLLERLEGLLRAEYRIENRFMLRADLYHNGVYTKGWDVINEAVIARGKEVLPIEVRVDLNEGYLTSYIADGVIVSTSTGSTGYALAANGPILPPELRNMMILPIAPHLSFDRAVILAEGAQVNLFPSYKRNEVVISIDGLAPVQMVEGDHLMIKANKHSLHMIRFGAPNYFYRDLALVMRRNPIVEIEKYD